MRIVHVNIEAKFAQVYQEFSMERNHLGYTVGSHNNKELNLLALSKLCKNSIRFYSAFHLHSMCFRRRVAFPFHSTTVFRRIVKKFGFTENILFLKLGLILTLASLVNAFPFFFRARNTALKYVEQYLVSCLGKSIY